MDSFERTEKDKLIRGKKKKSVYFSTMCDVFQPSKQILETSFKIMKMLLEYSFDIIILTKGFIPLNFIELFSKYPDKIKVQIGLITLDNKILNLLEPDAPYSEKRLENIINLQKIGVYPTLRLDPMFPKINSFKGTDSKEDLELLFSDR